MNNRTQILVFAIFLSIAVGICGYLHLNPKKIYSKNTYTFGGDRIYKTDYTEFEYSVLISIVVGILLLTFMRFFSKRS